MYNNYKKDKCKEKNKEIMRIISNDNCLEVLIISAVNLNTNKDVHDLDTYANSSLSLITQFVGCNCDCTRHPNQGIKISFITITNFLSKHYYFFKLGGGGGHVLVL